MELHHLRTFVAVAEERHLTRAAERLCTSQPAISAHIKSLEEELGLDLFERTPRGMRLTPAGTLLLERARQVLLAARDFLQQAQGLKDELMGCVRIGLNTDALFLRLTALHAALSAEHPRLEIEYLSGRTGSNVPALRTGRLDAAFVSGEVEDSQLARHLLCHEELAVAVPDGLRDRLGDGSVAALAGLPWVHTSPDCAYYRSMRAIFAAHGCEPVRSVMVEQEDAMWAMVRQGQGLGIMRRTDVERPENAGRLHALPLSLPPLPLYFTYLANRAGEPLIRALKAALATVWDLRDEPATRTPPDNRRIAAALGRLA